MLTKKTVTQHKNEFIKWMSEKQYNRALNNAD